MLEKLESFVNDMELTIREIRLCAYYSLYKDVYEKLPFFPALAFLEYLARHNDEEFLLKLSDELEQQGPDEFVEWILKSYMEGSL